MKLWKKSVALVLALVALLSTMALPVAQGAEDQGVPLTATTFPDPAFLAWAETCDTDSDGSLSLAEREAVTQMDLRKQGITDLTGLAWFSNLESLNCSENQLTSLVLPPLPELTTLTCNENPDLSLLDLTQVPALDALYCFHSSLSALDLHTVPALTCLVWGGSPLDRLDLSGNPDLRILHVLGGDLTEADLSHNPKLDTLLWNHTRIQTLDLSQQTALTFLNCTDNQLTALDLSTNNSLEAVYAGSNRLLAIRMPSSDIPFLDLGNQQPGQAILAPGENSIPLTDLVPWMQAAALSELQGATVAEEALRLESPNQTVTYHYTDGKAQLAASLVVTGENGWKTPLTISDWTYGQPPAQPQAEAAFGTVTFSYAPNAQGPFQEEVPTQAGTWYGKATVAESDSYAGLEAVTSFTIHPATPFYPNPEDKTAVYGDRLQEIPLEPGFFWEDSSLYVGDAGQQVHEARFVPEDTVDFLTVEHIPVNVSVHPYDGTHLPIPPCSSLAEVETLVIRHGEWVLQPGKDYQVDVSQEDGMVQVTIQFQGNYTGTVLRSFPAEDASGGETGGGDSGNSSGSSNGGSTGSGGGSDDGENDSLADPDRTGVSQWLNISAHTAYLNGHANGTFAPEGNLTRAQAAQMFYGLLQDQDIETTVYFADVSQDAWYAHAVNALASAGFLTGVGEQRFAPERPITRGEFVTLAMRFARPADGKEIPFSDVQPDDWFSDAVSSAVEYGWICGFADGTFRPNDPVTRAQTAVIVNRMLARRADVSFIDRDPALHRFPDVSTHHWAYYSICEASNGHHHTTSNGREHWTGLM